MKYFYFELFKEFCNYTEPKFGYATSKKTNKTSQYIYFATAIHPLFTELYNNWYIAGKKTVPANIAFLLDSVALAYWAMGDGGKCGNPEGAILILLLSLPLVLNYYLML